MFTVQNNLATADTIVKLVLAFSIVAAYRIELIVGPVAKGLMILSVIVIILFVLKIFMSYITRD